MKPYLEELIILPKIMDPRCQIFITIRNLIIRNMIYYYKNVHIA